MGGRERDVLDHEFLEACEEMRAAMHGQIHSEKEKLEEEYCKLVEEMDETHRLKTEELQQGAAKKLETLNQQYTQECQDKLEVFGVDQTRIYNDNLRKATEEFDANRRH